MNAESPDRDACGVTSLHLRRAKAGDRASLEVVVRRLHPLLLALARRRLLRTLGHDRLAEDLAQDAWATALPRLPDLPDRDGRATPVVLKFLATTMFHRLREILRRRATSGRDDGGDDAFASVADADDGVVTRVMREEARGVVSRALEELDDDDREILLLRGAEGRPYAEIAVAVAVAVAENTLAQRYRRALGKLRERLPNSVFDAFEDD
jgi:RNA polymerase sigma-70 factor, ECF subfamily